jgi:hypothetical protein
MVVYGDFARMNGEKQVSLIFLENEMLLLMYLCFKSPELVLLTTITT